MSEIKILLCGDVVGRSGREVVIKNIPSLTREFNVDLTVINGENSSGGFGITTTNCKEYFDAGVDIVTTGNHVWKQKDIISYINNEPRLLRPQNYIYKESPGKGMAIAKTPSGKRVLVVNIMCQLFMNQPVSSPMYAMQEILDKFKLGSNIDAIVVDLHGEASSEKMAFAQMFDGQISIVVGTHTHIPTADYRILNNGTAYQTDLGRVNPGHMEASRGPGTLCGLLVTLGDNGLAKVVEPVRIGAHLSNTLPHSKKVN